MMFWRETSTECAKIQEILDIYVNAWGQQVNWEKTTLFFSTNTIPDTKKKKLKNILGVPIKRQHEKYLGLPSLVRSGKNHSFAHVKDKVWHKLHDWKEKLLSQPNKEVLIKVVVQAIPNHSMSCFRLSVGLCWEIEGMICSHTVDKRKVYWIHWNRLC